MYCLDPQQTLIVLNPICSYFARNQVELNRFHTIVGVESPQQVYNRCQSDAGYAQYVLQRFMTYTFSPRCFRKGTIRNEPFSQPAFNLLACWGVPEYMFEGLKYYSHFLLMRIHFEGKYIRLGKKLLSALKKATYPDCYQQICSKCVLLDKTASTDTKSAQMVELVGILAGVIPFDVSDYLKRLGFTEAQRNLVGWA